MEENRFAAERLESFIAAALAAQGVSGDHARICAQRMLDADLCGKHAHGIFLLPPYSRRLSEGGYNLKPNIRATRETPVSALVDGDNGFGQVVVTFAADLAIEKAKKSGLAWVGIRQSNHAGAAGVYVSLALAHEMIGIYMAVANANVMPPWGGVERLLSTNPVAYAVPAGEEPPFLLDMATTFASFGKVKMAAARDEEMPVGWMIDREGRPLTDPQRADEGFLLPIGEHKGYGLNVFIGAMAGTLNGAAFGSDVINFNKDFKNPTNTGQVFFAMRPDLFRDLGEFKAEMDLRIREIRNSTPMKGRGPIRLPGEGLPKLKREMLERGIPVAAPVLKQLRGLAVDLELEDRLEA